MWLWGTCGSVGRKGEKVSEQSKNASPAWAWVLVICGFGFVWFMFQATEDPAKQSVSNSGVHRTLSRKDFGDDWPLNVDEAQLGCSDIGGLIVSANGVDYAVNGTAMGQKGFDGQPKYRDLREIWTDRPGAPGLKKDLSPILNSANVTACQQWTDNR